MRKIHSLFSIKKRNEKGFTLLEYCAGAAVILVLVWTALQTMGGNLSDLLNSIGAWAETRSTEIDSTSGTSSQ